MHCLLMAGRSIWKTMLLVDVADFWKVVGKFLPIVSGTDIQVYYLQAV